MTGMELIAALAGGLVSDAAAAKSMALAGAMGVAVTEAVKKLSRKRMETARDIMVGEVRLGIKSLDDAAQLEEIVACMLRYGRAAEEGAARLNLRLMAATMNGMYSKSRLTANEFLYYADWLSSMKREEAILVGVLHKHTMRWKKDEISDSDVSKQWDKEIIDELVPAYFTSRDEALSYCGTSLRTGLIMMAGAGWEGYFYKTTPLTVRLMEYIGDIESVLERDRQMNEQQAAAKD